MPNHNIDDFSDAIRHATEQTTSLLIKHLQNPTTIYPEDLEAPITYINGMSAPTTFSVTTEYIPELLSKLVTSKTTGIGSCYNYFCDGEERTCEVCGEPINELSRHICDKCFAAAKKYKNALTDREVAFGG